MVSPLQPDVELISPHNQVGASELDAIPFHVRRLPNFDKDAGPFMDTAAVLTQLDLLISCESSVAHLAGALGAGVWLALPYSADWRWLRDRSDSPWYPRHRLYRQPRAGDWDSVFQRLASELQTLAE